MLNQHVAGEGSEVLAPNAASAAIQQSEYEAVTEVLLASAALLVVG